MLPVERTISKCFNCHDSFKMYGYVNEGSKVDGFSAVIKLLHILVFLIIYPWLIGCVTILVLELSGGGSSMGLPHIGMYGNWFIFRCCLKPNKIKL